jgi:hypothetical protein
VSGVVVDDSLDEVAVPNATLIAHGVSSEVRGFRAMPSVITVSDAAGGFSVDVTIPADWTRLWFEVRRSGFETDSSSIARDDMSAARVHSVDESDDVDLAKREVWLLKLDSCREHRAERGDRSLG